MLKRFCSLIIASVAVAACSESSQPTAVIPTPLGADQAVLAQLTCRVDAAASTMSCAPAGPSATSGRSNDLILGGPNLYVKMTSTNVITTAGVSVTANVTVKNLTSQPWSTSNGTTADPAGVKVFFQQLPTPPVVISNPTDSAAFTSSQKQPYFQYAGALLGADGILSPGETSSPLNWNFTLNGQTTFSFGVLIIAKMPDETGPLLYWADTLAQTDPVEYLQAVWGAAANDVWVGDPNGGPTAMQHWNGSSWTPSSTGYCATAGKCATSGIGGTSSSDVWAVGSEILHNTGAGWTFSFTPTNQLRAVWGSSTSNAYAAGDGGDIYQYNGTSWSALSKATTGLAAQNITSVWGSSASNVYFGTADASTPVGQGIRRFNGTTWSTVNAGITAVRALWGSSATDIWAGGDGGLLRRFNGTTWSTVSAGFGSASGDAIFGIWGSSSTDVFVSEFNGSLWHYNGTSWFKIASPANVGLYHVWSSGNDVFAVGYANTGPGAYSPIVVRGKR